MSEEDIPIYNLFVYKMIREKSHGQIIVSTEFINQMINQYAHYLPKPYKPLLLKELEKYRLLKKLNRMRYELIERNIERKLRRQSCLLWK